MAGSTQDEGGRDDVIDLRGAPAQRGGVATLAGHGGGGALLDESALRVEPTADLAVTDLEVLPEEQAHEGHDHDAAAAPEVPADETVEAQVARRRQLAKVRVEPNPRRSYHVAKRALDLAIAVPALILASPLIAVIALIIRLESPGPAIFKQHRVGQHGKLIRFYKFRTMYVDARERFPELYEYKFSEEQLKNLYYKGERDPRNTRFGAFIRKTTLDELPNLFNVIIGNVSLVGPRPELQEMVQYYSPEQLAKFSVKSGITGLAACSGRNELSVQEQISADVEYVANQSLWFDLTIIFRTAWKVVRGEGAQ